MLLAPLLVGVQTLPTININSLNSLAQMLIVVLLLFTSSPVPILRPVLPLLLYSHPQQIIPLLMLEEDLWS